MTRYEAMLIKKMARLVKNPAIRDHLKSLTDLSFADDLSSTFIKLQHAADSSLQKKLKEGKREHPTSHAEFSFFVPQLDDPFSEPKGVTVSKYN